MQLLGILNITVDTPRGIAKQAKACATLCNIVQHCATAPRAWFPCSWLKAAYPLRNGAHHTLDIHASKCEPPIPSAAVAWRFPRKQGPKTSRLQMAFSSRLASGIRLTSLLRQRDGSCDYVPAAATTPTETPTRPLNVYSTP